MFMVMDSHLKETKLKKHQKAMTDKLYVQHSTGALR